MSDPLNLEPLMSREQWNQYVDAWCHGWTVGVDEGRRRAEAELAAIQRAAVASVRAAATLPPRDADADRRRAERSAAYWAGRRGEGGAA